MWRRRRRSRANSLPPDTLVYRVQLVPIPQLLIHLPVPLLQAQKRHAARVIGAQLYVSALTLSLHAYKAGRRVRTRGQARNLAASCNPKKAEKGLPDASAIPDLATGRTYMILHVPIVRLEDTAPMCALGGRVGGHACERFWGCKTCIPHSDGMMASRLFSQLACPGLGICGLAACSLSMFICLSR